MTIRPRRSALYMPGSNARALEKARSLPADVLILDLEDAVAPALKEEARVRVVAALREGGYGSREVVVRVNGASTPWGRDDLLALAGAGADAVLLPKVGAPGDIMRASRELREAGAPDSLQIWAMMETPMAILNADSLVRTAADPTSRLTALVMGVNDLVKDTRGRLTRGRATMVPYLALCVATARAYGVDILDGVFGDLTDEAGLLAECEQGRDLGMDGKTLIHPGQIAVANEAFRPSDAEIAWSRKVLAAFAEPGAQDAGVIALEGRMIERLHAEIARRTIDIADALGLKAAGSGS
jgi:citrate lyase subunit beta/citryl-CoA lyase